MHPPMARLPIWLDADANFHLARSHAVLAPVHKLSRLPVRPPLRCSSTLASVGGGYMKKLGFEVAGMVLKELFRRILEERDRD